MATFRAFGPFVFDMPPGGLAPGKSTPTFWNLDPPLKGGTVTFTAIPIDIVGPDGTRLATQNPAVHKTAGAVGGSTDTTLHVDVVNVGQNPVFKASMFISYVEV